jgi:hypothetical protein
VTEQFRVAAVAALEEPIRPLVVLWLRCHVFFPSSDPLTEPYRLIHVESNRVVLFEGIPGSGFWLSLAQVARWLWDT